MSDVRKLLEAMDQGDPKAADELLPLVYEQLRQLAARKRALECPEEAWQPTGLVQEAWRSLAGGQTLASRSRGQFFAIAAEAMRRLLIDNARSKLPLNRGTRWHRPGLPPTEAAADANDETLLVLNDA